MTFVFYTVLAIFFCDHFQLFFLSKLHDFDIFYSCFEFLKISTKFYIFSVTDFSDMFGIIFATFPVNTFLVTFCNFVHLDIFPWTYCFTSLQFSTSTISPSKVWPTSDYLHLIPIEYIRPTKTNTSQQWEYIRPTETNTS